MEFQRKNRFTADYYIDGINNGDRLVLSQSITIIESGLDDDKIIANKIIETILPKTGNSIRIGITGVPGVGKSTFIEVFATYLTSMGKKVAVLAIDPSSKKSKGSIMGDKTRMPELSNNPDAFIRPSAAGAYTGGVGSKTWESLLTCEAAGYDIIIVETVGVGQSETMVREIVDFFLLLSLAGAGDELQGFKRGIMELADAVLITKADRENLKNANLAKSQFSSALHLFPAPVSGWSPTVSVCSAIENKGIKETWSMIVDFVTFTKKGNYFEDNRKQQMVNWMYEVIEQHFKLKYLQNQEISDKLRLLEKEILKENISPIAAAEQIIKKI